MSQYESASSECVEQADTERPWTDASTLRRLYVDEQLSLREVADRLGCTHKTVGTWLDRHGIETRPATTPTGRDNVRWQEHVGFGLSHRGYENWWSDADGGVVKVHRLAAVAWFGSDAVCGMDVHHENGCTFDTREGNVELLLRGEHTSHHYRQRSQLEPGDIRDMRDRFAAGEATQVELADEYGVGSANVSEIVRGNTWADVGGPIVQSEAERARDIRHDYATKDVTQQELADQYGVSRTTVGPIVRGESFPDAGGPTTGDTE